jgi:hypothetical protein
MANPTRQRRLEDFNDNDTFYCYAKLGSSANRAILTARQRCLRAGEKCTVFLTAKSFVCECQWPGGTHDWRAGTRARNWAGAISVVCAGTRDLADVCAGTCQHLPNGPTLMDLSMSL